MRSIGEAVAQLLMSRAALMSSTFRPALLQNNGRLWSTDLGVTILMLPACLTEPLFKHGAAQPHERGMALRIAMHTRQMLACFARQPLLIICSTKYEMALSLNGWVMIKHKRRNSSYERF
ncbi:hypothetical protein GN244_ATG09636 [Phytophthora infestans]|uniref:Uncharacterized protein n=1 Tax=Phytophthora infestans TaxID=4787 RepID=A0A833T354_PHYIN|nr:hypothetical protein GN244_ATG09636 [Phytophthora infestans]